MIELLIPVLLTVGLAGAVWPWTGLYDRVSTLRLLATLVTTSALIVCIQLILGSLRLLEPFVLRSTTASLIVLSLVLFFALRKKLSIDVDPIRKPTRLGAFLGLVTLAIYLWIMWVATLVPPYGWDAMTYHLTDILHIARSRSLTIFPFLNSTGVQTHFFFPKVGELHGTWFYILSGGTAESYRTAGFGLIPMSLTAAVATRAVVEALGWRKALPWVVPGVMLTPILASQPIGLEVDVAFAAFVLSSFAFAVWAEKESRFTHLAFAALAGGMALGVKISFIYFFLPIAVVLVSKRVLACLARGGALRLMARLLLLIVVFAAVPGYWYIRNMVTSGNPLWPTHVEVAGVTVFEGPVPIPRGQQTTWYVEKQSDWIVYPFQELFRGESHYSGNGFGPLFAAGYVCTALLLPLAFIRGSWPVVRVLLALPVTAAPFLFLSPTSEPRFVISMIGFGFIGLAGVLEVTAGGLRRPFTESAEEPDSVSQNRLPLQLAQVALGVAVLFAALGCLIVPAPRLDEVVLEWREGTWEPTQYYGMYYGTAGDAFNWIAENGGSEVTVTFTNSTFIAPVMGWHNRNKVVQAAIEGERKVVESRDPVYSYQDWREFLRRNDVDYIVQWVPWWTDAKNKTTEAWIEENPLEFSLVESFGGRARIYAPVWNVPKIDWASEPHSLPHLSDPEQWELEYTTGVETTVRPASPQGVQFSYAFTTSEGDYCDWRAPANRVDWTSYSSFSFDLTVRSAEDYLVVYIKGPGGHESIRFRIDLSQVEEPTQRIELPLRRPDSQTPGFSLSRVGEVHFIFSDLDNERNSSGEVEVSGFRLEPRGGSSASTEPAADDESGRSQV